MPEKTAKDLEWINYEDMMAQKDARKKKKSKGGPAQKHYKSEEEYKEAAKQIPCDAEKP